MGHFIGRAALIVVLGVSTAIQPALAGNLNPKPRRITVSGRIVAKVPTETFTTVGLNYQSLLFEIQNRKTGPELVKLSYRFLIREPQLPSSFLDYSLVHKFRMTRDEGCDESWSDVSSRYIFDDAGKLGAKLEDVVYARNAPALQLQAQSILPCYVVTPEDYRSSKRVKPLPEPERAGGNPPSRKPGATTGPVQEMR